MALVMAPFLLEDPRVTDMFPGDAIARAREYLVHVKGGIGAYSDSKGNPYVRQEVRVYFHGKECGVLTPRVLL